MPKKLKKTKKVKKSKGLADAPMMYAQGGKVKCGDGFSKPKK